MSGPSALLGVEQAGASSSGAGVKVVLPDDARRDESRFSLDLGGLPGARITAQGAWTGAGDVQLRGACIRAPSDRWAPGVEDLVLARATDLARGQLGLEVEAWFGGPIERDGPRFTQRLEGSGRRAGAPFAALGKHVLGFVGDRRDATACSVVCVEPAGGRRCRELVDSVEAVGSFVDAPPPSPWVRLVLASAEHPTAALVAAAALSLAVVGALLATRPRPARRPRAR